MEEFNRSLIPALSLDFTTGALDSRITFTRASVGTYFDTSGVIQTATSGTPRFDHNPTSHAALGLLIEEQRTNLLLNSASLATQTVTVTAVPMTLSFYGVGIVTLSGAFTQVVTGLAAFPSRTTLTFTPSAGALVLTATGAPTFANLEAGAFATSFIPTAGATVTRVVDAANMTGSNFSSWFNAVEGSFVAAGDFLATGQTNNAAVFGANDGGSTNRAAVFQSSATLAARIAAAGTASNPSNSTTLTAGTPFHIALAYGSPTNRLVVNGVLGTSSATSTGVAANRLGIGGDTNISLGAMNGHISKFAFYNKRLPDAVLQGLA